MNSAANVIDAVRRRTGLSLRRLGQLAGTSHSAVAAFCSGRRQPSVATLERVVAAAGLQLGWVLRGPGDSRPLTKHEARSLALHCAVARELLADPPLVLAAAAARLTELRAMHESGHAEKYIDEWQRLVEGPLPELVDVLTSVGERARALRPVSPFAGIVSPDERDAIWKMMRATRAA